MPLGEFDLIRAYFQDKGGRRSDTRLGVGDDCALLRPQSGCDLAVTVDTLVAGVHFLPDTHPRGLGHKCLAVNLSDLASMGAEPAWVTLALTLPQVDEAWLAEFSEGFLALAARHSVDLVGGDTTRGLLSITVQAMGHVPQGRGLRRSAARPGDGIYMTGELGLGGLGLKQALGEVGQRSQAARTRLERPEPRVQAGLALREIAAACIDISDGLAADLGHIVEQSGVAAVLDWEALPLPDCVKDYVDASGDWRMPLTSGDDYELCFTVPAEREPQLARISDSLGCPVTRVGTIQSGSGLALNRHGKIVELASGGYQHFSGDSKA